MKVQIAEMAKDISYIKKEVGNIKEHLEQDYVTKAEFEPVKEKVEGTERSIIWGVRLIVSAVVMAVLATIGLRQF